MRLQFDANNKVEMPDLIIGKKNYDKIGILNNVDSLTYDCNLMSEDTISFTVYKELNNIKCNHWEQIRDKRLVYLTTFNEWFELSVNIEETSNSVKTVTGKSLCEAELSQVNIVNTEINTEDDIARDDYEVTKFYNPAKPSASLLHRLLKKAPNYTIKYVDKTLWDIQRSFSIDGTSIYDELVGEISEEFGCLFIFDSTNRSISVYDLETNCNHCGYRGDFTDVCPECGSTDLNQGYGYDTSILIDRENLAENITLEGKSDEVKNYFRIVGGDDVITSAVAACNPTGTNYIHNFSKEDKEDMSSELSKRLAEYETRLSDSTPLYQNIMEQLYDVIDKQLYLESGMMPDITRVETNAQKELSKLTAVNLSPVAVTDVSVASVFTINNAVLGMAKCLINSTVYKVTIIESSLSSQTWKGKFRVENNNNGDDEDEQDIAENSGFITIQINDDYAYYVKQKVQKIIDRDDVYLVDLFDNKTSLDSFKLELKKYCLSRLNSFGSAYQSVIDVMTQANCANSNTYGDIYKDLYLPYFNKLNAIQAEIKVRESELKEADDKYLNLVKSQTDIQKKLNLESFLGEILWKELCSFRREDTYENSNYNSDGLDNDDIFKKAEELIKVAKKEIVTASTLQYTLSANIYNLLAMPEFRPLSSKFELGNWIRVSVNEKIYRLRLIHYKIDFSSIQNLEVEFSDVTQTANGLNDLKSLSEKVTSIATNFNYVAHQAEQGEKSFSTVEQIKNDGLNAALYNISTATNQDFKIDEHGFLGRKFDDIKDDYEPKQIKIINNLLVYTDDYWKTSKMAVGDITYYDPIRKTNIEAYGVLADAVVAGKVIASDFIGGQIFSSNYSADGLIGSYFNLNTGDFSLGGKHITYDSKSDKLNIIGTITFESIDYSDENTKNEIKKSLGITDVEKDISEFNDSLTLTPMEKKEMLDDWTQIQAEYQKNLTLAKALDLYTNDNDNTNDDIRVIKYISSYSNLSKEIPKCELNKTTTSTVLKSTDIYNLINEYHSCNVDLNVAFNEKIKSYTDAEVENLSKKVDDLKNDVDKQIDDVNKSRQDLENYVDGAFYDNIITQSEAQTIKTYIENLNTEKQDINSRYVSIFNNESIDDNCKNNLKTAKDAYDQSHGTLMYSINAAISVLQNSSSTDSQKNTAKTNMNNSFDDYRKKLSTLSSAFESAIDSITSNKLNNFIDSDYKSFVEDIKTQVDNKSDIYYQSQKPHPETNYASGTIAEYDKFVGDLWYDSTTSSKKTYIYVRESSRGLYRYIWKEMEVPTEFFDLADGKSQLFTSKPSNYNVNDLWLIGNDYVPSTISGAKQGFLLVAKRDNVSYSDADWSASLKYTDDTVAIQAVSDNILTPAEKRDIYIEFKNITESYNKLKSILSVQGSSYESIDITNFKKAYSTLSSLMALYGIADSTSYTTSTLTSNESTEFKAAFANYYLQEADIQKQIQQVSDNDIKTAQNAAIKAQKSAQEALDLLSDIASDNKITPTEKIRLKEKHSELANSYNALYNYYVKNYGKVQEMKDLVLAFTALNVMVGVITEDMNSTYSLDDSNSTYNKEKYTVIINDYYTKYNTFVSLVDKDRDDNITYNKGIAEEAKNLGNSLKKCLGFTTEISSDYVISPYIGGGYLDIKSSSYGEVRIDPTNIRKGGYIFGVYDKSDNLVCGVDTSGNGTFSGNITATSLILKDNVTIPYEKISNTPDLGVYIKKDGSIGTVKDGSSGFLVSSKGLLQASNAIIYGTIYSSAGKIGGFSIDNNSITSGTWGNSNSVMMCVGTDGKKSIGGSPSLSGWCFTAGNAFGVTKTGALYGNNVNLTGVIKTGTTGDYAVLSSGRLSFYSDNTNYASFSNGFWSGTSIYGTAIHSEPNSNFVTFGKRSNSSSLYTTSFLINYGLNPDGRIEDVQTFGSFLATGAIVTDSSFTLNNPNVVAQTIGYGTVDGWGVPAIIVNTSKGGSGLYIYGNLYVNGSSKNRVVTTEDFGDVCLSAYETATPYFGDIGSGVCDSDGLCYIYLDDIFKQTVLENCDYYIFLQSYSDSNVYPLEKHSDYFVIKGKPNARFDWEVKCRQKGTETSRLDSICIESEEN